MSKNGFFHRLFATDPTQSGLYKHEEKDALPLLDMLEDLFALTEEEWGLYAFIREPLKGRIDMQSRIRLTEECRACGQFHAREMKKLHGRFSYSEYGEKLGLEIDFPVKPNDGSFVIFAQFVPPRSIHIYTDCIHKAERTIEENPSANALHKADIMNILAAHEMFHYVEEVNRDDIFTKNEKLLLWSLGPLKNRSSISCLSEIAGMAFAKELTGISYSPYLLDVFLVYGYSPAAASNLYRGIMRVTGREIQQHTVKKSPVCCTK